jgi:transcriptional regulator with PAS, ATPase and Fis domain
MIFIFSHFFKKLCVFPAEYYALISSGGPSRQDQDSISAPRTTEKDRLHSSGLSREAKNAPPSTHDVQDPVRTRAGERLIAIFVRRTKAEEVVVTHGTEPAPVPEGVLIGSSQIMAQVRAGIDRLAQADCTVLITGGHGDV